MDSIFKPSENYGSAGYVFGKGQNDMVAGTLGTGCTVARIDAYWDPWSSSDGHVILTKDNYTVSNGKVTIKYANQWGGDSTCTPFVLTILDEHGDKYYFTVLMWCSTDVF